MSRGAASAEAPQRIRSLLQALFCALLLVPAARGQNIQKPLRGRVERIEGSDVVIDLGARDHVQPGDLFAVERAGRRIARLRVETVFVRRSIARVLEGRRPIGPGDAVVEIIRPPQDRAVPESGGDALDQLATNRPSAASATNGGGPASTSTNDVAPAPETELSPEEVLRRLQQAPREPIPFQDKERRSEDKQNPATGNEKTSPSSGAAPRPEATPSEPPSNRVSGSVRLSYTVQRDTDSSGTDFNWHSPRLGLRLDAERLAGLDLRFRLSGDVRAVLSGADLRDRADRELDQRSLLYEAALEYRGHEVPVHLALGRVGLWDLAAIGPVDGGRLGVVLGPLEVGGFGGFDAALDLDDRGRTKWGGYLLFETPPSETFSLDASAAYMRVSTDQGSDLDRELVAGDLRLRLHPWLSAYGRVELDLYGNTLNLANRSNTELTDVYASVSVRPVDALTLGLSYDRRLPFIGQQALADLVPEARSTLTNDPFETVRVDGYLYLPQAWWIGAALDLRQGGVDRDRTTITLEGGSNALMDKPYVTARISVQAWQGDLLTGGAGRIGATVSPWQPLELGLSYEFTKERYREIEQDVTRHNVEFNAFWTLSRALSSSLAAGWETGDDVERLYATIDFVWRF